MATKEIVTKVWIDEGCIICDACETACPEVFDVQEDNCVIRPEALNLEFVKPRTQGVFDAAEECPVDVIKFETVTVEVSEQEAAESAAMETKADPAPSGETPSKPAGATKTDKPAKKGGLEAAASKRDPAISALLEAATSRGGNAGILRSHQEVPEGVQALRRGKSENLPPDARQAKVHEEARKARQDPDAQRRAVSGSAALTVGWLAFGGGLSIAAGPALLRFSAPNVLEEPDPRVRVGKLRRYQEMVPGDVIEDYKPLGIWMVRDGARLAALNIICTHLGCIPNWLPNDRKFKCPCHGSGYRPDGVNFEGPTPRPLERFKIFIDEGLVVVDKSKKYQSELGQWDQAGSYVEL